MDKLIEELTRLYLAPETVTREALAQHIRGQATLALKLATADGLTRALAIPFPQLLGNGKDVVQQAFDGQLGLTLLLALVVLKPLVTAA